MPDLPPLRFAAIGLDHRHIYDQVGRLLDLGATASAIWTPATRCRCEGFVERFPQIERVDDPRRLLEDRRSS